MSEMIPEDVTRTASEAYDAYANGDWRDIRECIACAIMAERERCASFVRHYAGEGWKRELRVIMGGILEKIEGGDQP